MVNPLFLHFCLWLLYLSEQYLSFPNKEIVCETLQLYMFSRVNSFQMHLNDITKCYPAIDFAPGNGRHDELSLNFLGNFLEKFYQVAKLTLTRWQSSDWVFKRLRNVFRNLTLLR